jgi:hypothetical protein
VREQGQRLELADVAGRRAAERVDVVAPDADAVGEEDEIELRRFRDLREAPVMGRIDAGIGLGIRMALGGDVVAAGIQEGAQMQGVVATRHVVSLVSRQPRPKAADRTRRRWVFAPDVYLVNHFYVL